MYSKIPLLPNPKSEIPSRKPLAIGNCTAQFVLGLVGNPKKFCSCDAAHKRQKHNQLGIFKKAYVMAKKLILYYLKECTDVFFF